MEVYSDVHPTLREKSVQQPDTVLAKTLTNLGLPVVEFTCPFVSFHKYDRFACKFI